MKAIFTKKNLKINQKKELKGKRKEKCTDLPTVRAESETSVKHDNVARKLRLLKKIRMIQTRLFVRPPTNMSKPFNRRPNKEMLGNVTEFFVAVLTWEINLHEWADLSPKDNEKNEFIFLEKTEIGIRLGAFFEQFFEVFAYVVSPLCDE